MYRVLSVPGLSRGVIVCLRGGNCNNGSKCGARYLNANNAASVANWNIGGSLSYPLSQGGSRPNNAVTFPQHTLKINPSRDAASKR